MGAPASVNIPVWWYAVLSLTKGINHAIVTGMPGSVGIREVQQQAQLATVSDPDSTNFDAGTLTVDFAANGQADPARQAPGIELRPQAADVLGRGQHHGRNTDDAGAVGQGLVHRWGEAEAEGGAGLLDEGAPADVGMDPSFRFELVVDRADGGSMDAELCGQFAQGGQAGTGLGLSGLQFVPVNRSSYYARAAFRLMIFVSLPMTFMSCQGLSSKDRCDVLISH